MELENPPDSPNFWNAGESQSACCTSFSSAPSSPGSGCEGAAAAAAAGGGFFFFSAPSSPMHYSLSSPSFISAASSPAEPFSSEADFSFAFEFSNRSPSSAEELFLNGQIRPMKLSSHLQGPQDLAPPPDLDSEADEAGVSRRDRSRLCRPVTRRTRSLPAMRSLPFLRRMHGTDREERGREPPGGPDSKHPEAEVTRAPPVWACYRSSSSSSTSSSTSAGGSSIWRRSKRWLFLRDLLRRSNSCHGKDYKFWRGLFFSVTKDRPTPSVAEPEDKPGPATPSMKEAAPPPWPRPTNELGGRRRSAHELHYTANRVQAEEMKRRTSLPYRQGVLAGLWELRRR